jgi:arsenate reductase
LPVENQSIDMKKIYHLSSCNTCKKIIDAIDAQGHGFVLQDIKTEKITPAQLKEMHALAGSYEALFSRRSQKYRPMGLHEKTLSEKDYHDLILEEYTFLKRPVAIVGKQIFIGNDKKTVEALTVAAQQ